MTLLDVQPISSEVIDKISAVRTFNKWCCRKASRASNFGHERSKDGGLEIAKHLLEKDPLTIKRDLVKAIVIMLQKEGIKNGKKPYSKITIRDWLKPIKGKVSRPRLCNKISSLIQAGSLSVDWS